jgi:hypothetical protein
MESQESYLLRAMGQFKSAKTPKIVKHATKVTEWQEQLAFCKWLKNTHPDILFRSDIQSAGKLSGAMQNIKQIIDPYSGFPDITIYSLNLMIELKSMTAALSGEHYRNQVAMHDRLKSLGWRVYVCRGAEEAKEVFKQHYNKLY